MVQVHERERHIVTASEVTTGWVIIAKKVVGGAGKVILHHLGAYDFTTPFRACKIGYDDPGGQVNVLKLGITCNQEGVVSVSGRIPLLVRRFWAQYFNPVAGDLLRFYLDYERVPR